MPVGYSQMMARFCIGFLLWLQTLFAQIPSLSSAGYFTPRRIGDCRMFESDSRDSGEKG